MGMDTLSTTFKKKPVVWNCGTVGLAPSSTG